MTHVVEKVIPKDILDLQSRAIGIEEAPSIAINVCIGVGRWVAQGHKPFVVQEKNSNGETIWKSTVVEFETLPEALLYPGAIPYGSSTLCTACKRLDVKKLYPDFGQQ